MVSMCCENPMENGLMLDRDAFALFDLVDEQSFFVKERCSMRFSEAVRRNRDYANAGDKEAWRLVDGQGCRGATSTLWRWVHPGPPQPPFGFFPWEREKVFGFSRLAAMRQQLDEFAGKERIMFPKQKSLFELFNFDTGKVEKYDEMTLVQMRERNDKLRMERKPQRWVIGAERRIEARRVAAGK